MPSEQHFINKTDEMLEKFIEECEREAATVSYTHLTLPTKRIV